ncbi:MAG: bifunctional hydroxymethylpyrimidine kinase/phosphomethylpyrimidine kinase [Stackebrandtia sp.]
MTAAKTPQPPVALTIAGSDSGGGAGIQADLKTFAAHDVYGVSALTAVTAQNTRGVTDVHLVPAETVAAQLDAVLDDFDVAAAKTGMLGRRELLELVAERSLPVLVVDPVLLSTTGASLYEDDPRDYLRILGPHTALLTPNLPEAAALLGRPVRGPAAMRDAAKELADHGPRAVLLKGGHVEGEYAVDVFWRDGYCGELAAPRVDTGNVHGAGCTLSAAVTANLAAGLPLPEAVAEAKGYITSALSDAAQWRLGGGAGPVCHNTKTRRAT